MSSEINFLISRRLTCTSKYFFDENKVYVIGLVPETTEYRMGEDDATCLAYVSSVVITWSDLLGIEQLLLEWMFKGFKIKSE